MAYIKKKLSDNGKKAFRLLMDELKISMHEAQKLIDKKRLFCNGVLVKEKNKILDGIIELIIYENNPKGLDIVYENEDFAAIEKPSGVLTHPNGRNCTYSLCDEIWHLWGKKACVAHRLDKETSGILLVAKHKNSQIELKTMFEKRLVQKSYLALVEGKTEKEFIVNEKMDLAKDYDISKTRMHICENGKEASTQFYTLEYFENLDASLVLAKPLTGRQHQIRLHLFHVKHKILGDPLYGLKKSQIEQILDDKINKEERIQITGAKRLLLHSFSLEFTYKGQKFLIQSKKNIKDEFLEERIR
ncbi:RluA family pseudouridine synthase [Campylobacter insulaenigrae]|uniref:RluA family pseudouridine synthase n=1 Tax=Campylobacter insulaenigrae TaxID=260714 RepID=UPI002153664B|nr:RluA family pseudouridine synthase [Campylobacter insulaenigrae]MCR6570575.1 RluA family pseudouridine synthase [Campylobacter insulaenigrae]MCR6573621.1 RluA family pseudouridine synthase [Campylobacter insulaenigrae]MCR6579650.1 RluA family pseudouridine synthase [Campylobacter insulaenigrae]MCR6582953.1 RluA family pseudouridine synthase [Campylobacter insulaenigrae]MCR6587379.1 RluA family pseudouridine synthase [Campylobacter insulaenigrae]